MYLLYSAALALAALISAPWWLVQMARLGKYRAGLGERLGFVPRRILRDSSGPVIWIHAVSVGEALAISELVARLRASVPAGRVVISTTTHTGQKLARDRFGAENVFYFPLDFAFAIRPYLRALKPSVIVLAETEFWPNFLRLAKSSDAKVLVTNGRISDRSYPRYLRFRGWMRMILRNVDVFLAQTDLDAQRLMDIGAAADRVSVAGNLKFEVKPPNASATFVRALDSYIRSNSIGPVIVAGSTVEGEEPLVVTAFVKVLAAFPNALLILAPRHKERFSQVVDMLAVKEELPWLRRSLMPAQIWLQPGSVLLLDTIGELAAIYSLCDVAFVGGSLVPRGGHNILEPAYFGKATVVGPSTENFRDIISCFAKADAVRVVQPGEFANQMVALLSNTSERQQLGERARQVYESQSGATERTVAAIWKLLGGAR